MARLFVENLTVLDCAYLHGDRGLLGESWMVDLELDGGLDHQGMVLDFGEVKKSVKQKIDAGADHCLLVPGDAQNLELSQRDGRVELTFVDESGGHWALTAPASSVRKLPVSEITPMAISTVLVNDLLPILPKNVQTIGIHLRHEDHSEAFYHYCHGLKKHAGDCQRIAHGHRSRIVIKRNGYRDEQLEAEWAARWQDIYIGSREDLSESDDRYYRFEYRAPQGHFSLTAPKARCELIDTDTTVECIAQYIADTLAEQHAGQHISVRAYEGVNKGAIAEAFIELD